MLLAFIFLAVLNLAFGGCPQNSIGLRLNSSICYSFHPSLSQFVIAERECNSFGADLVSLKNKYTNVYVTQLANLFFKHLEVEQFWTNGHRLIDTKIFRWISGDEIVYGNLINKRTEDDENCMSVNLEKGFWKHEDCFTRLPFVCEFVGDKKVVPPTAITFEAFKKFEIFSQVRQAHLGELIAVTTTPLPSPTTTSTTTISTSSTTMITTTTATPSPSTSTITPIITPVPTTKTPKSCPPTWTFNNVTGYCYGVFHNMSWENAEQKCVEEGSHLASIHSEDEGLFVAKLTEKFSTLINYWYGQTYIGLITKDSGKTWQWTDVTPFDYHQWYRGEPNNPGIENCGQLWSSGDHFRAKYGDFNNGRCHLITRNFVCKKLPSSTITITSASSTPTSIATTINTTTSLPTTIKPKTCPPTWIYNNDTNHCYGVFHNMSWYDAEQRCVQDGAHLTSIHNKDEGFFVAKLTQNTSTSGSPASSWGYQTHIGLYTKDEGKTWKWSDGTLVDYVHWGIYEPDPHPWEKVEHCGQIWSSPIFMHVKFGDFNDRPCHLITANFVCKKLPY